ncbi:hypothetical protein M0802_005309 [Mischocyttarus mexicanus]|nr:hypothetical protein M0802_005309 [Mischocyttarus mexicanus]
MANNNLDWRNDYFRQGLLRLLSEVIHISNYSSYLNPFGMESHFFLTAPNKNEYLEFMARLILHIKESIELQLI